MKKYLLFSISFTLFLVSTGFVILQAEQETNPQQDEDKKIAPLSVPKSSKSDKVFEQISTLQTELSTERKKNDSVNNIRERNLSLTKQSLEDLKKANTQYRKSLNRLKYVLDKFPPDSVMKFYGEYKDNEAEADTTKKKIESIAVDVPAPKRGLIKRIFGRKN